MIYEGKERYRIACERFLEKHPAVKIKLNSLNPAVAECIDISIDKLRELELNKELEKEAQFLGIDSVELVMKYAADSEEEFKIMQKEHYKKIAETLGIGWEEFCELNNLEK
jgi:hypothetical protein